MFSLSEILQSQAAAASNISSSTSSIPLGGQAQKRKAQQQQQRAQSKKTSASQLSFEANLSPSSRQKLSNLSSCLLINQLPARTGAKTEPGAKVAPVKTEKLDTSDSRGLHNATPAPTATSSSGSGFGPSSNLAGPVQDAAASQQLASSSALGRGSCGRSSVSSSSSLASSASSTTATLASSSLSHLAMSPTTCSSMSSSSSSSSSLSDRRTSTSTSSPVSSVSSSPTMQLGGVGATVGGGGGLGLPASSSMISSQDWKSAQSGQTVMLTEEERRTLVAEGYPIPQKFPLTKSEERSLKKIRRKIKNKISAQESRRKKKEYMEELEKRVQLMELRIVELERENKQLLAGSLSRSSNLSTGSTDSSSDQRQRQQKQQQQQRLDAGAQSEPTSSSIVIRSESDVYLAQQTAAKVNDDDDDNNKNAGDKNSQLDGRRERADRKSATAQTTTTIAAGDDGLGLLEYADAVCKQQSDSEPADQQHRQLGPRKNSVQSNFSTTSNDDEFIDGILMSQERQEAAAEGQLTAGGGRDEDLVGNLVGHVCGADLQQAVGTTTATRPDIKSESN